MLNMYKQIDALENNPIEISNKALRSIDLWMRDAVNDAFDIVTRREAAINAITLLKGLSESVRDDLPEAEQKILIKVFGQIIKSINKYIRKEIDNLDNEFAGLRLIHKLINS